MNERFLVLGATGLVGSLVLQQLLQDGRDALGATRRPGTRRHVRLDLLEPDTFEPALRGVSTAMLMSRPGDEAADLVAEPFVGAMVDAGVRRVVVLSALGAQKRPESSLRKVELLVERSGLHWTHVRPNFFMQVLTLPPLAAEISARGTLSLPLDDASIAYVDARDVAAVVHRALVDARLKGRALDVNGPQALDHDRIVQVLARVTGMPVRYVRLGEGEARTSMLSRGFSCCQVERVLAFYRLIREGFCSETDEAVADLLGRPLKRWEDFAAANRSAWVRRQR